MDNTPSNDTERSEQEQFRQEQQGIPPLQQEDQRPASPEPERPAPEPEKAEEREAPTDPRAARMEEIAARRQQAGNEELTEAREAIVDPAAPKPAVEEPKPVERMIKLKIRGQEVEMPESEVIARAQKVDAADSYLTEARGLLQDAKTAVKQPDPAPQQQPAPQPKVDRLAQAIEKLQLGEPVDSIRTLLDEEISERAQNAVRSTLDEDRQTNAVQTFDDEVDQGYEAFRKDHPTVAGDIVAATVVTAVAGGMEGELIARYLEQADDPTKTAFQNAGITADGVRKYNPQDAHSLYKDMHVKGFPLIRPSAIIQAAGKTVAERFAATTQGGPAPAPKPQPAPVDRTGRKEAIQQPERTTIPRDPKSGQFTPAKTEPERAQSARADMRGDRRAGVRRG